MGNDRHFSLQTSKPLCLLHTSAFLGKYERVSFLIFLNPMVPKGPRQPFGLKNPPRTHQSLFRYISQKLTDMPLQPFYFAYLGGCLNGPCSKTYERFSFLNSLLYTFHKPSVFLHSPKPVRFLTFFINCQNRSTTSLLKSQ